MTSTEIIESLYSAFQRKDYDAFRALCSEDIEWVQNIVFPNGGHHFGAEAVIENVFKQFDKDWEYFQFKIEDIFECQGGAQVTVVGAYIGKHKLTNKGVAASTAHVFEIENQKVKKFRQFTDTALITAAMEK
ncbi:MAG: nuclear transport factor 2 family protein [Nitrospinae bacterium]|nr:nuclear transport factor 2 family protein [Nitrospinota bacterium]